MSARRANCVVRSLRDLARDKKQSGKTRLRACEMLMAIDPSLKLQSQPESLKPRLSNDFSELLRSLTPENAKEGC
jgi:hypothetical protein